MEKVTKDAGGNGLYSYRYEWAMCEKSPDFWGARGASDVTPILETAELIASGKAPETEEDRFYSYYEYGYDMKLEESTGSVSYQEMSHTVLSGEYMDVYHYGKTRDLV